MKNRDTSLLLSYLSKISKKDSIKMSYIINNLEVINKKYNLNLSSYEKRLILESKNFLIRNMRNPFDISDSMKPK